MKVKSESEVAQSSLTLSDPMDCGIHFCCLESPGFWDFVTAALGNQYRIMTVTLHSGKPEVWHFLQVFVDFSSFFSVQTVYQAVVHFIISSVA